MNKTFFKVGIGALLSTLIAGVLVFAPGIPIPVFAVPLSTPPLDSLNKSAEGFKGFFGFNNLDEQTLPAIIGVSIQIILSVLGLVFLILVVYGGILWMVAEGDTTKVGKARGLIFHAVLGLIIVLSAYAITAFVLSRLVGPITAAH